jgi:uncharacterized protein YbjT (DUF2867 family)
MKKKMLITLATGKTGYATAVNLLRDGYPVRIFVRSRNSRALELEKLGAEVFVGAFDQYRDLLDALKDIENVYYCYPYKPGMPADMRLFIDAAKEAKINAVVFMGQRTAEYEDTGSALTNDIRKTYSLLEQSGLKVVYFVPGYFADIPLVTSEYILQLGIFPNPYGKGKNPWISIEDMGRCIAALLKNPEPYLGQKLFPTGPKSIDPKEMVAIISKVLGRKIISFNIPEWLYFKAVIMEGMNFGFDRYAAVQSLFYNKHTRLNRFDIAPTDVVKQLTGNEPEDFETIVRQYFERSPFTRRNLKSRLIAFWKFNKMPFIHVPGKHERMAINHS